MAYRYLPFTNIIPIRNGASLTRNLLGVINQLGDDAVLCPHCYAQPEPNAPICSACGGFGYVAKPESHNP